MTGTVPVIIRTKFERPPGVTVRQHRANLRGAHATMGAHWVQKFLPGHFEPPARHKYGYAPRGEKYLASKDRLSAQGHRLDGKRVVGDAKTDLVLTGRSKRRILTATLIRGYPTRATVDMSAPKYFKMRFRFKNQPNKARELLSTTDAERKELREVLRSDYVRRVEAIRQPQTVDSK